MVVAVSVCGATVQFCVDRILSHFSPFAATAGKAGDGSERTQRDAKKSPLEIWSVLAGRQGQRWKPAIRQIRNLRYAAGMLCEGAWHFYSVLFDFIRFCTVRQIKDAKKCAL